MFIDAQTSLEVLHSDGSCIWSDICILALLPPYTHFQYQEKEFVQSSSARSLIVPFYAPRYSLISEKEKSRLRWKFLQFFTSIIACNSDFCCLPCQSRPTYLSQRPQLWWNGWPSRPLSDSLLLSKTACIFISSSARWLSPKHHYQLSVFLNESLALAPIEGKLSLIKKIKRKLPKKS